MTVTKKWSLCLLLLLATTLNYLDRQTLSILAPSMQRELHLSNEALGWLFAIFYYRYTFSHVAVGPILDRVNLRWAFAFAVLLWSLVSGLTGLVNGFVALLIFRLFLGIVEAANWPGSLRMLARLLQPSERALGNGIFTSGTSVAALVAPVLILSISAFFGWRWAYVLIGSLGVFWVSGWLAMTQDKGLVHVWRDPHATARISVNGQLQIFKSICCSPRFLPVLAVAILVNPCLYFSVNWLPTYFSQQRGFGANQQLGWVLTAIYLGLDLGNMACGAMILMLLRKGRSASSARRTVFIFATFCMVGCSAVPVLPLRGAIAALILFNLGQGIWTTVYLTMAQEVSPANVSTAIGILSGSGSFAGAIAMWAVGHITQRTSSFAIPMVSVAIVALLAPSRVGQRPGMKEFRKVVLL